jgi:hypothetical protein
MLIQNSNKSKYYCFKSVLYPLTHKIHVHKNDAIN